MSVFLSGNVLRLLLLWQPAVEPSPVVPKHTFAFQVVTLCSAQAHLIPLTHPNHTGSLNNFSPSACAVGVFRSIRYYPLYLGDRFQNEEEKQFLKTLGRGRRMFAPPGTGVIPGALVGLAG